MKTAYIFFLIGVAVGIVGMGLYVKHYAPVSSHLSDQVAPVVSRTVEKTKTVAGNVHESLTNKLDQWHLTPAEIKADLANTGKVVRRKTTDLGESVSDVRILSVITAKFVLDPELSAMAIDVTVTNHAVTLNGRVKHPGLIAKAVAISLDTIGVITVTSNLTVEES